MAKVENKSSKKSIWAKVTGVVKTGSKIAGKLLLLIPKAAIYPAKKPLATMGEAKHDAVVSIKESVGIKVPEEKKKYDPPILMSKGTKYFSVIIKSCEKGRGIAFEASRTFIGDIPYLTDAQLEKIKAVLPNVSIFRKENKIIIEIDVEQIVTDQNLLDEVRKELGKHGRKVSEEHIKQLAVAIEIDRNFKAVAKITGGELKEHTDKKWLYTMAGKLLSSQDTEKQQKPSESISPFHDEKSSEIIEYLSSKRNSLEALEHIGQELLGATSSPPQGCEDSKHTEEQVSLSGQASTKVSNSGDGKWQKKRESELSSESVQRVKG